MKNSPRNCNDYRRSKFMEKILDNSCKNVMNILNNHNYKDELPDEVKDHLTDCHDCKLVFEDNLRLKEIVKGAVERTPVSEDLADRIMKKIKES